jgi:hypothetical protein
LQFVILPANDATMLGYASVGRAEELQEAQPQWTVSRSVANHHWSDRQKPAGLVAHDMGEELLAEHRSCLP